MIIFYVVMLLIKVCLIHLVYQDLSMRFDLPVLNFLQFLMVVTFLLMIKLAVFGISYADVQAFQKISTVQKIVHEMTGVFLIAIMTSFYFFYTVLL